MSLEWETGLVLMDNGQKVCSWPVTFVFADVARVLNYPGLLPGCCQGVAWMLPGCCQGVAWCVAKGPLDRSEKVAFEVTGKMSPAMSWNR